MTNMVKLVCNGLEKISYIFVTSDWEKYHFAISDFGTYQISVLHWSLQQLHATSSPSSLLSLLLLVPRHPHRPHHAHRASLQQTQQTAASIQFSYSRSITRYWPNLVRTKAVVTSNGC
jgi:hypothetical protein